LYSTFRSSQLLSLKIHTGDLLITRLQVVKTEQGHQNSSHFQSLWNLNWMLCLQGRVLLYVACGCGKVQCFLIVISIFSCFSDIRSQFPRVQEGGRRDGFLVTMLCLILDLMLDEKLMQGLQLCRAWWNVWRPETVIEAIVIQLQVI